VASAIVVGAGVNGAALALRLARDRWDVTLIDRHAPGHVRAASGGESRLLRFSHGPDAWYARSAWRARELWLELDPALLAPCGVAWFARREDGWEAESERVLRELEIPVERLDVEAAARMFPSFAGEDLAFVLWEPRAGVLHARRAVQALAALALAEGAKLRLGTAEPDGAAVRLGDEVMRADRVVWACGAWLPALFPYLVPVRVTRQDYFYFGASLGWESPPVPGWVDYDGAFYGVGDLDGRGFKVAPDEEGPPFEPESGRREADPARERAAREYLAARFPALADAPLLGTRCCQYAITADSHFVVAAHPDHEEVWLLGGDSGHGFKHGPALAEHLAAVLAGKAAPEPRFALAPRAPDRSLRTAGAPSR
jgi:sarcosine oxidase